MAHLVAQGGKLFVGEVHALLDAVPPLEHEEVEVLFEEWGEECLELCVAAWHPLHLEEEAFLKAAGTDACRFELLEAVEGLFQLGKRGGYVVIDFQLVGQLLEWDVEQSVIA